MKLLVVESTGKASRMLDLIRKAEASQEWAVISCEGHYAGLSPKSLGFDPKKDFAPSWKSRNLKMLKRVQSAIENAEAVYAATDFGPDGEAIAHQICVTAERSSKPFHRLQIPVIDVESFGKSVSTPGTVRQEMFNTYLAREFIDRVVRFRLGPVLEERLGSALLERIPSLLLTELARRERKIRKFKPESYWIVRALLENGSVAVSDPIFSEEEAEDIVRRSKATEPGFYSAMEKSAPPAPFTTSSLLQFLSDRYGFLPAHSMHMCETLYGLGYITYPYTDSRFVHENYLISLREYISTTFGDDHLDEETLRYGAEGPEGQLEAIRPVDVSVSPSKSNIKGDMRTVYQAIWFNSLASQGSSALLDKQECRYQFFGSPDTIFTARGTRLAAGGWHQLSSRLFLDQEQELLEEGLAVVEASAVPDQKKPPLRHTAASLIAWMDEKMVGRPHNYSEAISFLVDVEYVEISQGRIAILPRGEAVLTFLKKSAPDLIDPDFHAEIEEEIDSVSSGEISFASFAQDYWKWASETEEKMRKSSLRPRFKAPGGSKTRIWLDRSRVYAFSSKEDWWSPIVFDQKGRICPADDAL